MNDKTTATTAIPSFDNKCVEEEGTVISSDYVVGHMPTSLTSNVVTTN